jgi:hypothetical protein
LDGACQHEEISPAIRRILIDDLLGRNGNPLLLDPSVPTIFRIFFAARLNSERGLDGIRDITTKTGFVIPLGISLVVGAVANL